MSANGTLSAAQNADHTAAYAYACFNEGACYKYSRVTKIRNQLGENPSYALCEIPIASGADEVAPTVAGVEGPLTTIKGGTRAKVYIKVGNTQILRMVGSVRNLTGEFAEEKDEGLVEIVDDRWLLRGLPLIGSWWATLTGSTKTYSFREWRWHVNPKGEPNCMLRSVPGWPNLVPMICTPGQGLGVDDSPADLRDANVATDKAGMWTYTLLAEAIRFATSATAAALTGIASFPNWGDIPNLTGVEEPGRPIKSLKNTDTSEYPIKAVIQAVEFVIGEPEQHTVIELDNI